MAKVSETFPSTYMKAVDLNGRFISATISKVEIVDVGGEGKPGDVKPVMHFSNRKKALVLNKTNAGTLAKDLGDEMDDWMGQSIEIFPTTTEMQGKTVDCLRVRLPQTEADDDVDV